MITKEIINRRSVREYKTDPVPEEYITEIIKAGQFASSGNHNKAIEFVVVKNKKTKEKIFDIVSQNFVQEFVKQAPLLIIPVTDTSKTHLAIQDLSVATENMFLQATALGLGTVWKNLQPDGAQKILKLLKVPKNFIAINLIPVGYPAEKLEPHTDKDFSSLKIHFESW